jgi:hypothetical protein
MFKVLLRSGLVGCAIAAMSAQVVRAEMFSQVEFSVTEHVICNTGRGAGENYLKLNITKFGPSGQLTSDEVKAIRHIVLVDGKNTAYSAYNMGKTVADACGIPRSIGNAYEVEDSGSPLHVPVKFLTPPGVRPMYLLIQKEGSQTPIKVRL